jgi:hypothetical protein
LRAFLLARQLGTDRWQFAVSLESLRHAGLDDTYLRWLLHEGYLEHRREQSKPEGPRRNFRGTPNQSFFTAASCFILTERGGDFARVPAPDRADADAPGPQAAARVVPYWDGARRLYLGSTLVKHFRQDAPAQTTILSAFQEEGWPARVANPLADQGDRGSAERAHDAVNRLNRGQKVRRLRFRIEGGGEQVCWELLATKARGTRGAPRGQPGGP